MLFELNTLGLEIMFYYLGKNDFTAVGKHQAIMAEESETTEHDNITGGSHGTLQSNTGKRKKTRKKGKTPWTIHETNFHYDGN